MSHNRAYVDDSGRILPQNQSTEWEDDFEDESEFSTYFTDQKVEIPTFPDDDKVSNTIEVPYTICVYIVDDIHTLSKCEAVQ